MHTSRQSQAPLLLREVVLGKKVCFLVPLWEGPSSSSTWIWAPCSALVRQTPGSPAWVEKQLCWPRWAELDMAWTGQPPSPDRISQPHLQIQWQGHPPY